MRIGPQVKTNLSRSSNPFWLAAASALGTAALLILLLVGALTFDRSRWPGLIGDEATYLMMAESFAWDLDLRYERADFERFVEHWKLQPEGLILQSGDGGEHITFGKPFFYPLFLAPFVRISPTKGPFVANVALFALAALMASRSLRPRIGSLAPLWVSGCLFASVAFAYVFWAHADLFLLALTAVGLSLVFEPSRGDGSLSRSLAYRAPSGWQRWGRWFAAGGLLAMVVFSRPFYLPLFAPVFLALPHRRRLRAGVALCGGALLLVIGAALVHRLNANAWTSYGAQRRGFYAATGYPGVDFPARSWSASFEDQGNASWVEASSLLSLPPTDRSLWWWNGLYLLVGRHVGLLPYFLPLVLGFSGGSRGAARWALPLAACVSIAGFFLYRPFNFYGGGGALANRYFMPLYPAFWFAVGRPRRPLLGLFLVGLAAAPFLWPLWMAPRSYPLREDKSYRWVGEVAQRSLPYETTQSHLKPAGRDDVVHGQLWVKFLSPTLRQRRDGGALLLNRGSRGQLLIGSGAPLERVELRTLGDPSEEVRVLKGGRLVEEKRLPDGRLLTLELGRPRARHPMWWTWERVNLYQLTLASDSTEAGRLTFRLRRDSGAASAAEN